MGDGHVQFNTIQSKRDIPAFQVIYCCTTFIGGGTVLEKSPGGCLTLKFHKPLFWEVDVDVGLLIIASHFGKGVRQYTPSG